MKNVSSLVVTVLAVMIVCAVPVHARTPLGSLDLDAYCQDLGFDRAELIDTSIAQEDAACNPDAACRNNNWYCVFDTQTPTRKINMTDACEWQYTQPDLTAWPLDPHDAFTWVCYTVPLD